MKLCENWPTCVTFSSAHDVQPEYETMHANSGHLPNECIFITMHEFLSDHWGGQHVVPSYDGYLAKADHRPAYRFHKRFLQTLQSKQDPRALAAKSAEPPAASTSTVRRLPRRAHRPDPS